MKSTQFSNFGLPSGSKSTSRLASSEMFLFYSSRKSLLGYAEKSELKVHFIIVSLIDFYSYFKR